MVTILGWLRPVTATASDALITCECHASTYYVALGGISMEFMKGIFGVENSLFPSSTARECFIFTTHSVFSLVCLSQGLSISTFIVPHYRKPV